MIPWLTFIKERFDPLSHLILITCLFSANLLLAIGLSGNGAPFAHVKTPYIAALIVMILMFFHLRLFDEIKDYHTDIRINPDRPLPRGLIGLFEFKQVTGVIIVLELLICAHFLSWPAFVSALVMVGYSLLMYKEFFIGTWLGPRMELYAISHTVVSGFMALFICSVVSGLALWEMTQPFFLIALSNWMVFNIFEFARKTFGNDEERPEVESYSRRLTPPGAVAAVLINAALALVFLWGATVSVPGGLSLLKAEMILTAVLALAGIIYAVNANAFFGRCYRFTATLYLIVYNVLVVYYMLR